jgi:hypothetical protein
VKRAAQERERTLRFGAAISHLIVKSRYVVPVNSSPADFAKVSVYGAAVNPAVTSATETSCYNDRPISNDYQISHFTSGYTRTDQDSSLTGRLKRDQSLRS